MALALFKQCCGSGSDPVLYIFTGYRLEKIKKIFYTIFNIYKNKFKIKSGSYIIDMPLLKLKK